MAAAFGSAAFVQPGIGRAQLNGVEGMPTLNADTAYGPALVATALTATALWEETAWAGVVQTRLERRHTVFVAALLTAIPFALVHWPLAFFGSVTLASTAIGLLTYLIFGVIFRPMLAVVMRGAPDSVLLVAVMHTVFNWVNNDNGIVAGLLTGDTRKMAAIVLTAATAVIIRGRLGRAYRRQLDTEEH